MFQSDVWNPRCVEWCFNCKWWSIFVWFLLVASCEVIHNVISFLSVDTATENNSGSEPEVIPLEPSSELDSSLKADVVQEKTQATSNTSKKKTTFKCPSCDKSFTRKCMMERHYLTHSKPHLCSECGQRFSVLRGLHAHLRRHTGEKLFGCSECGTEFAYKSTYVRHMQRHSLIKPHTQTCTLCESKFVGVLALQRHRCSALKKTFICSLCPETFDCRQSLADHENQHSGNRDFVCEMCGDGFLSSSSLATHRVTHLQKKNCCDVLGFGSSDMSVLKSHLSKHSGEKLFICEVCGKGCSHQSALKHHMLTHTGERPYVCETCGKRCSHASALQNHMRIHTGKEPGQQPICDICGKKFSRTVKLKYHMSVHTGVKPYACDQCDKTFSNPSNMKLHMMIHAGVKKYGCIVCGRRFTHANSLRQHRRLHTGEWRYSCQVCGKGFMNSGDFRRHLEVHHPQESGEGLSEKVSWKSETLNFKLELYSRHPLLTNWLFLQNVFSRLTKFDTSNKAFSSQKDLVNILPAQIIYMNSCDVVEFLKTVWSLLELFRIKLASIDGLNGITKMIYMWVIFFVSKREKGRR